MARALATTQTGSSTTRAPRGPAVRTISRAATPSPYLVTTRRRTPSPSTSPRRRSRRRSAGCSTARASRAPVTKNGATGLPGSSTGPSDARRRRLHRRAEAFNRTASPAPAARRPSSSTASRPSRPAGRRRPHQVRHGRDRVDGEHRARHRRLPGLPRRPAAGVRLATQGLDTFCVDTSPPRRRRSSTTSARTTRTRAATCGRAPTRRAPDRHQDNTAPYPSRASRWPAADRRHAS